MRLEVGVRGDVIPSWREFELPACVFALQIEEGWTDQTTPTKLAVLVYGVVALRQIDGDP